MLAVRSTIGAPSQAERLSRSASWPTDGPFEADPKLGLKTRPLSSPTATLRVVTRMLTPVANSAPESGGDLQGSEA
jgi:hypothetical protein